MSTKDPWEGLRNNLLLRALSARDALLLAPHFTRVHLEVGQQLVSADEPIDCVYFPETAVACLCALDAGPDGHEVAIAGREGLIGWEGLLGFGQAAHGNRVLIAGGTALTISCSRLFSLCAANPSLNTSLVRFIHVLMVQMGQTIVSNARDPLDRRLSRWMLMLHDRIDGDMIAVTHSTLAALLNVRRASVTDALHILEGDRILTCTRGKITVRDRGMLEGRAGTAYGMPEAVYRGAIGAFGKSVS